MRRPERRGAGRSVVGTDRGTAKAGRYSNPKNAYFLGTRQDPAELLEQLLEVAERDFGDLERAGVYLDSETIVYGDGGAHLTALPEHVTLGLLLLHIRRLAAQMARERAEDARKRAVLERRSAIRLCEVPR